MPERARKENDISAPPLTRTATPEPVRGYIRRPPPSYFRPRHMTSAYLPGIPWQFARRFRTRSKARPSPVSEKIRAFHDTPPEHNPLDSDFVCLYFPKENAWLREATRLFDPGHQNRAEGFLSVPFPRRHRG